MKVLNNHSAPREHGVEADEIGEITHLHFNKFPNAYLEQHWCNYAERYCLPGSPSSPPIALARKATSPPPRKSRNGAGPPDTRSAS